MDSDRWSNVHRDKARLVEVNGKTRGGCKIIENPLEALGRTLVGFTDD
jgi:hypothetical protein